MIELTGDTLSRALDEHERLFVEFYAPWCGHCKQFAPHYEMIAFKAQQEGLKTRFAKIDVDSARHLVSQYSIAGYPSLKLLRGGKTFDFEGDRIPEKILSFLHQHEDPPSTILQSEIEDFFNSSEVNTFGVVAVVKKGSVREKVFLNAYFDLVGFQGPRIKYAISYLPKNADAKTDASLTMRRSGFAEIGEEERISFDKGWKDEAVVNWVLSNTYPLVGESASLKKYGFDTVKKIGKEGSVVVLFDIADDLDDENDMTAKKAKTIKGFMRILAAEHPYWKFAAADHGFVNDDIKSLLGNGSSSLTVLLEKAKYRADCDVGDQVAVASFLKSVRAGQARPWYMSEKAPAVLVGDDGVTTVVGTTFEEIIMNPKRDVFVEFYAPWCGHCKELAPIWSDLGRRVQEEGWHDRGVVIGRMDAVANECQEDTSGGFPKLVLYPAVSTQRKLRSKVVFTGNRDLSSLVDFLLENTRKLQGVQPKVRDASIVFDLAKREVQKKRKQQQEL